MGPIVKQCETDYADKNVTFVKFDFTSDETTAASKAAATQHGVDKVYTDNEKKTGFLLLVNATSGEIVGKLTARDDIDAWHAAINKALGS